MKSYTFIHAVLGAVLLSATLTACGDNGDDDTTETTTPNTGTDPTTAGPTTVPTSTTDPDTTNPTTDPDTTTPTTVDPDTTNGTTDPTTGDPTADPTTDGDGFVFEETPPEDYIQIDRHGAVEAGTAGIKASSGLGLMGEDIAIRDDYNKSNPEEDAAGMWIPEIGASVTFFHDNIDDDLMALGLTPATIDQTVAQAGPVIVPDTIKYDPAAPVGYPNGRALEDQVVDLTLAAVLLDLTVHDLRTFADIPLNPPANDVPFADEFPFLAPPHL